LKEGKIERKKERLNQDRAKLITCCQNVNMNFKMTDVFEGFLYPDDIAVMSEVLRYILS